MIERLQRRMTLLVFAVIFIVAVGIVVSINLVNYEAMCRQAGNTLAIMIDKDKENPDDSKSDDGENSFSEKNWQRGKETNILQTGGIQERRQGGQIRGKGQPFSNGRDTEELSNTYRIRLGSGGEITWQSSRADLYTDEQVSELAGEALALGKTEGRIGTQFFRTADRADGGKLIAVLDARLELQSLRRVLLITIAVAVVSGTVLGIGALLLIRRMIRPVREAFEKQQRFVSDASHEMKTPLAIISANAQVLETEIGKNESLSCIRGEVERTAKLVQNLLTLAHSDQKEKKESAAVELSKEIEGAVLTYESVTFEAGRGMEEEIAENIRILGRAQDIRQLMNILLDNALKYGDAGTAIRVELKKIRHEAVLTVINAAEDIPAAELPRLFERFYRGDQAHSRTKDGNGLGLSIARGLTEGMNGKICAESGNHEMRFIVSFPILRA